ncbi:OmpA family protein [Pedobacter arcticus]|uniref:OmpA family protein n=1 Tax=Pedobacter arcticus TaxID=752140 RepID=UPI000303B29B|nr:OmpA family protein [Pedobacter arcticus]
MKKASILLIFSIIIISCTNDSKNSTKEENEIIRTIDGTSKVKSDSTNLNWDEIPDLKNIGNFPFFTAPTGLQIKYAKNGASDISDYEKMENYLGNGVYTTEGKLAILGFEGSEEKDFNQRLFDKSVFDYIENIGAKKMYKGDFPKNETDRKKIGENMYSVKHGTYGLLDESEAPFSVYAFKNNGKKYILNIQSNSAQGTIFIMELKDFEQTIKKYTATTMLTEIEQNGKAILNINFDTDKSTLKPDGQEIVEEILKLLNTNSDLKLSIEGHTDNTGNVNKNKQLSTERANTVMYSLASKGIDIKRLKSTGFGSEKPIKPNDTDINKAINRRVELVKF